MVKGPYTEPYDHIHSPLAVLTSDPESGVQWWCTRGGVVECGTVHATPHHTTLLPQTYTYSLTGILTNNILYLRYPLGPHGQTQGPHGQTQGPHGQTQTTLIILLLLI